MLQRINGKQVDGTLETVLHHKYAGTNKMALEQN